MFDVFSLAQLPLAFDFLFLLRCLCLVTQVKEEDKRFILSHINNSCDLIFEDLCFFFYLFEL